MQTRAILAEAFRLSRISARGGTTCGQTYTVMQVVQVAALQVNNLGALAVRRRSLQLASYGDVVRTVISSYATIVASVGLID